MGYGQCRVGGCGKLTSIDYSVPVGYGGEKIELRVCGMWDHYAQAHKFHPTKKERDVVMNSRKLRLEEIDAKYNYGREIVQVMFVEKTANSYDHEQKDTTDDEFNLKLLKLLEGAEIIQWRGGK